MSKIISDSLEFDSFFTFKFKIKLYNCIYTFVSSLIKSLYNKEETIFEKGILNP